MWKKDYDEFRATHEQCNNDQKRYKQSNLVIKKIADAAGVARLPDEKAAAARKESNKIAQDKRMVHLGKIRLVKVDNNLMEGSFLVEPVPHYMMIMLLVHCFSEEFWSKYNVRKQTIDLLKGKGTNKRVDASGKEVEITQGASYYMLH